MVNKTHPALDYLARNADRLVRDAQLLINNERFSSAVTLCVIAIKEVGKHAILRWDLGGDTKGHREKQQAAAIAYLTGDLARRFLEGLDASGMALVHHTELSARQIDWLEAQTKRSDTKGSPDNTELVANLLSDIHIAAKESGIFDEMDSFRSGQLSKLKESGLYFDIDQFRELDEIGRNIEHQAIKWFNLSKQMVSDLFDPKIFALQETLVEISLAKSANSD